MPQPPCNLRRPQASAIVNHYQRSLGIESSSVPNTDFTLNYYQSQAPNQGQRLSNRSGTAADRRLRSHFSIDTLISSSLSADVDMLLVICLQKMNPSDLDTIQITPWSWSRFHITDIPPINWLSKYSTTTPVGGHLPL